MAKKKVKSKKLSKVNEPKVSESKANEPKRSKTALPGSPRRDSFVLNPFEVIVLGVDTSDPLPGTDLYMLLHKHRITKPLEQDMLNSISQSGVEQAITTAKLWLPSGMTVRGKALKQDEQHLVVIDGRRRTLHTRELCVRGGDADGTKRSYGVKTWPPKTGMTVRELAGLAIELNETGRQDDVLEKADQARIMAAQTQDEDWVASKFSVDVQTLKGWFKLRAECAPKVLDAVRTNRGGISASSATKLAALPPEKQIAVMEEAIAQGKTSVKQIEGMVRKAVAEAKGVKPNERPNIAPTKRKIGVIINLIQDSELDIQDEFVTRETAWLELSRYYKDGVISNKNIEILDKAAEERMRKDDGKPAGKKAKQSGTHVPAEA